MSRKILLALLVLMAFSPALGQEQYIQVFVTSDTTDGNLNGVTGGNAFCSSAATAAGLDGTYLAWLSDSQTAAADRIPDAEYRLVDGTIIANSLADLTDGTISAPIDRTEDGGLVDAGLVWTGTLPTGLAALNDHCDDWTDNTDAVGVIGTTDEIDGQWTSTADSPCVSSFRLYCFSAVVVPVELQEFSVE